MSTATPFPELHALLVEDSELDAELILRELARAGYAVTSRRVQTAADLAVALREVRWDIVLSDYKMPKFNGLEALAQVKASGLDLPLVLISGAAGEEIAVAAMRAGASDYLVKGRLATLGEVVARELREAGVRRARRATEAQVRRLDYVVQQAPVSLMITDTTGRIEFVNPKFTEVTGYTLEEVRGQNPRLFKSGLIPQALYENMWRTITAGEVWQGELQNRTKAGTLLWELATISPIRDTQGKITHFLAAKLDITARRQSDQKILEQTALLNQATDAIMVMDLQSRFTYWNRGAERLFGWTAAEVLGRTPPEFFVDITNSQIEAIRAVSREQGVWRGELSVVNKAGQRLIIALSVSAVRDELGQPKHGILICTDITERKKLEDQFLRAQRLESLGMLAAGIAHDMNNILAPVLMGAPLLRRVATEPGDLRLIATLEKSAERGASLVRQILGFAHGVGGEPQLVQVKHLFRDIINVATETFPKSIEIDHLVPSDLWPVRANPTQIHQVLLNLCVNARDAMPQGGALRLRAENCVLDAAAAAALEGARPGEWIVLHVEDTGMGIPPELVARIWEPFFTTKTADKGTGLGLSTVRGIVATHQGFITLSTAAERGTTFRVYLPAAEVRASIDPVAPVPPPISGRGELILLVDDEALIRDMAGVTLTRAGYRVLFAADGIEAMSLFKAHTHEIDLVVTDLDMPNLDGASLIQLIRFRNPQTRFLTISGLSGTHRLIQARPGQSEAPYLPKPFTAEMLLRSVQQAMHDTSSSA